MNICRYGQDRRSGARNHRSSAQVLADKLSSMSSLKMLTLKVEQSLVDWKMAVQKANKDAEWEENPNSSRLGDVGLQGLAKKLPSSLTSLTLAVGHLAQISDAGMRALGDNFPLGLKVFALSLYDQSSITNAGIEALVEKLPSTLASFELLSDSRHWERWGNKSEGLHVFVDKLPRGLTSLSLLFRDASQVDDVGFEALCEKLPTCLTSLALFQGKITDAGLQAVAAKLPSGLTSLSLAPTFNEAFTATHEETKRAFKELRPGTDLLFYARIW